MHLWIIRLLFLLSLTSLICNWAYLRTHWVGWKIPTRWCRWWLVALLIAYLSHIWGWTERPEWLIVLTALGGWFLVETGYNWLGIRALHYSSIPLFPRYVRDDAPLPWPIHTQGIRDRETLRQEGFQLVTSMTTPIGDYIRIRSAMFEDSKKECRIHATFVPQKTGPIQCYFSISSQTASGKRYVTDGTPLPFGGYFPDHWLIKRAPLSRSLQHLLYLHRKQIQASGESLLPWENDVITDLNAQQTILAKTNEEKGILIPSQWVDTHGQFTPNGRYRMWKEIWLFDYLGIF